MVFLIDGSVSSQRILRQPINGLVQKAVDYTRVWEPQKDPTTDQYKIPCTIPLQQVSLVQAGKLCLVLKCRLAFATRIQETTWG